MLIKSTSTSYPVHFLHVVRGKLWEKDEEFSGIEGKLKGIELKSHNRQAGSFRALHFIFEDAKASESYDLTFGLDRILVYKILLCLYSASSLSGNVRLEFGLGNNGSNTVTTYVDGARMCWNSSLIPENPSQRVTWGLSLAKEINKQITSSRRYV